MGPMSNLREDIYVNDNERRVNFDSRHAYCSQRQKCTGPGCNYLSGKTEKKRKKERKR